MNREQILEKYGAGCLHMSCIYLPGGEEALRKIIQEVSPRYGVLEIGTYNGISALILSEYFSKVFTVDTEYREIAQVLSNDSKNILYNVANSRESENDIVSAIQKENEINLAFIDGEHFNGELAKDWEMVKDVPYILVHDYAKQFDEVYDFCNNQKDRLMLVSGTFCLLGPPKKASKPAVKKSVRKRNKK